MSVNLQQILPLCHHFLELPLFKSISGWWQMIKLVADKPKLPLFQSYKILCIILSLAFFETWEVC